MRENAWQPVALGASQQQRLRWPTPDAFPRMFVSAGRRWNNLQIAVTTAVNYSILMARKRGAQQSPCLPKKDKHETQAAKVRPSEDKTMLLSRRSACRSVVVNLRGTAIGPHSRSVVREDQRPATRRQQRTHSFVVHPLVAPTPTRANIV